VAPPVGIESDTIVACATPVARSAIAVLRLSGTEARDIGERLCPGGPPWRPRRASLRRVMAGEEVIDEVLLTWMPGPNSYTGEDIVELSGHGNPVLIEKLLDRCVACGARPARPGEFTRRALQNGRMDLLQAESLAGLIDARSMDGIRIARAGMSGVLSQEVRQIREHALDLAAETEARLDQPGDDLSYMADDALAQRLRELSAQAHAQAGSWRAGRIALQGARVVLLGRANAGKSSLFNHLVGSQRALVNPEPGTTRDVVERVGLLEGLEVTWMDTAGQRDDPGPLEAAGMAMAEALTSEVDLTLVVMPLHQAPNSTEQALLKRTAERPRLLVGTHLDQGRHPEAMVMDCSVDNLRGLGVDDLRSAIRDALSEHTSIGAEAVLTSQRQHALFRTAGTRLADAATALVGPWGPAVAAEEIVSAIEALGELAGTDAREAVLDRLFSRFCVGK